MLRYALAITEQKNVGCCWLKILTGLELSATTPNNTQQDVTGYANGRKMQHPTMLGVVGQQCCVRLHGALGCC